MLCASTTLPPLVSLQLSSALLAGKTSLAESVLFEAAVLSLRGAWQQPAAGITLH